VKKKKKNQKSQKLVVGLALAVVGLAVLGVAAFFILRGRGDDANKPIAKGPGGAPQLPPLPEKKDPIPNDTTNPNGGNPMDDPKKDPGMNPMDPPKNN